MSRPGLARVGERESIGAALGRCGSDFPSPRLAARGPPRRPLFRTSYSSSWLTRAGTRGRIRPIIPFQQAKQPNKEDPMFDRQDRRTFLKETAASVAAATCAPRGAGAGRQRPERQDRRRTDRLRGPRHARRRAVQEHAERRSRLLLRRRRGPAGGDGREARRRNEPRRRRPAANPRRQVGRRRDRRPRPTIGIRRRRSWPATPASTSMSRSRSRTTSAKADCWSRRRSGTTCTCSTARRVRSTQMMIEAREVARATESSATCSSPNAGTSSAAARSGVGRTSIRRPVSITTIGSARRR